MTEYSWFDEKYNNGNKPTLEDRIWLLRDFYKDSKVKIPDRLKGKFKELLQQSLFDLKQDYSPSQHTITYDLLFSKSACIDLSDEEHKKYVADYRKTLEKYKGRVSFKGNFE
jgi:hypothetical protein